MKHRRPSPLSVQTLKKNTLVQLGRKDGEKCRIRFGRSDRFDTSKAWRTISVYVPAADAATLKEYCVDNDAMTAAVRSDDGGEYITVKVHEKRTKCKTSDGEKVQLADIKRHDAVIIVAQPTSWQYKEKTGVSLRARAVVVHREDSSSSEEESEDEELTVPLECSGITSVASTPS